MGEVALNALFSPESLTSPATETTGIDGESIPIEPAVEAAAAPESAEQAEQPESTADPIDAAPVAATPSAEPQIPLSSLKDAISAAVAAALASNKPAEKVEVVPQVQPAEVIALSQFERGTLEQRVAVMKQVLGARLSLTKQADGSIAIDPNQEAYVHSHLIGLKERAEMRAELEGFKAEREQGKQQRQAAAYQHQVDTAFHTELSKYKEVTPDVASIIADLMVVEQNAGKNPEAAALAAFNRAKHLGLRLKNAPGRPSTVQVAASGREQAQRVTASGTAGGAGAKASTAEGAPAAVQNLKGLFKDVFGV